MQPQPHTRPDSPNNVAQKSNTIPQMYNSMNSLHLANPEYAPLSSTEHDALNFQSPGGSGFASGNFRSPPAFNPFPPRVQQQAGSYREIASNFSASVYSPSSDIYGTPSHPSSVQSPQLPPSHGFESVHHPSRPYDSVNVGGPQSVSAAGNGMLQNKSHLVSAGDPYRQGLDPTANLMQTRSVKQQSSVAAPSIISNALHAQPTQQQYQAPYANGISHSLSHGHHGAIASQGQFGPQLASNGVGSGPGQGGMLTGAAGMNHVNGTLQNAQQQEEISTIFVVGFPDDMQEREFQNMFTFSAGFEAATLKIPNKEFTAYGSAGAPTGNSARGTGLSHQFPGSNDPYNIVTVNQGGVVIDRGGDGVTSWPAPTTEDSHYIPMNMPIQPPRKQIIGFAKFRTRQEALDARDALQGRRVDIERNAVLKAEMAKKNLHTKRGPGVGLPLSSTMPADSLANHYGIGANGSSGAGSEALTQRDKELGALGAMGIVGLGPRRDRMADSRQEDEERRRGEAGLAGTVGLGPFVTRGPRERVEEDERKRKEKEAARLRQNSFAFEAFHSVPQQMVRQGANSLLSAENGVASGGMGFPSSTSMQGLPPQSDSMVSGEYAPSPWGLREVSASAALRKMSVPVYSSSNLPARPPSPSAQQSSPSDFDLSSLPPLPLSSAPSQNGNGMSGNRSAPFSPQSSASSLPSHPSLPSRPQAYSPGSEPEPLQPGSNQETPASVSLPPSNASSVGGSQNGHDEELSNSVAALAVSTDQGTTSPQLPSPASGASSGTGRVSGDQNPPINTLYVGNLPSLSPSGYPLNHLEDRLRDLFSKRPGYRKLSFRQKSNGPMCFVEFEDVSFATKALTDLSGHTLGGLVKSGGIRLSYSKNPLGVRTPTSAGSVTSFGQQQQMQHIGIAPGQQFVSDTNFPSRHGDVDFSRTVRRDASGMTSPTPSYHYSMSPPPRFSSSPPMSPPFSTGLTSPSTTFPRSSPQGYGMAHGSSFSPFGISPTQSTIPDQPSADASNDHLSHSLSPTIA